jgi:hypothetical protein
MTAREHLARQAEEEREIRSEPLLLREEARKSTDIDALSKGGVALPGN